MNGEKVTIYQDKLLFSGVVFMLKRDIVSMITDYDFNKLDSPDTHSKSKCSWDKNFLKNYYNKELY